MASFIYHIGEYKLSVMANRTKADGNPGRENVGTPGGSQAKQNDARGLSSRDRYNAKHGNKNLMDEEQRGHLRNKERQMRNDRNEPTRGQ
jgi:hypothetical protein